MKTGVEGDVRVAGSRAFVSCLSVEGCFAYLASPAGAAWPGGEALQRHIDSCGRCRVVLAEAARGVFGSGAASASKARTFRNGQRVDSRYEIRRLIARGGTGEIYEVADFVQREIVALKTLAPAYIGVKYAVAQLSMELHLAGRVVHPNVCRVFGHGFWRGRPGTGRPRSAGKRSNPGAEGDETPFLTMELLKGETLARRMATVGRLDVGSARRILRQMALGLDAVHRAGLAHGDLSSENIYLERKADGVERVVIIDFGLAQPQPPRRRDRSRGSRVLAGTVAYMAPEQLLGASATPASDIYGLGVMAFQMLTGALPFLPQPIQRVGRTIPGSLRDRIAQPAPAPSSIFPELGAFWDQLLARCLARDLTQRFAHANQVIELLARSPSQHARAKSHATAEQAAGHRIASE